MIGDRPTDRLRYSWRLKSWSPLQPRSILILCIIIYGKVLVFPSYNRYRSGTCMYTVRTWSCSERVSHEKLHFTSHHHLLESKLTLNMLRVILLFSLVLSCSAFFSTSIYRQRVGTSSLVMGNLIDNFRFVKHYNRFTFKTLYKCVVAAGLEETLAGPGPFTGSTYFEQRVMITHVIPVFRCIHHLPCFSQYLLQQMQHSRNYREYLYLSIFNCVIDLFTQ